MGCMSFVIILICWVASCKDAAGDNTTPVVLRVVRCCWCSVPSVCIAVKHFSCSSVCIWLLVAIALHDLCMPSCILGIAGMAGPAVVDTPVLQQLLNKTNLPVLVASQCS